MTNTNNFDKRQRASGQDVVTARGKFVHQAERLLREVPITKVIGEYTPLRKTKKGLTGNCPRHEEPSRTLRVDPITNIFSCFFCGMRGDAIAFLENVEELTYGQALEALEKIKYSDEYPDTA